MTKEELEEERGVRARLQSQLKALNKKVCADSPLPGPTAVHITVAFTTAGGGCYPSLRQPHGVDTSFGRMPGHCGAGIGLV